MTTQHTEEKWMEVYRVQTASIERLEQRYDELLTECSAHAGNADYFADMVDVLTKQRDELLAALDKLARLGNEPLFGNSIGNKIALDAILKAQGHKT